LTKDAAGGQSTSYPLKVIDLQRAAIMTHFELRLNPHAYIHLKAAEDAPS
jgi:hypothetical protein